MRVPVVVVTSKADCCDGLQTHQTHPLHEGRVIYSLSCRVSHRNPFS